MSTEALHEKITATGRHEQNDSMDLDASTSEIDDDEFFDPDEDGVTFEKSFDSNERSSIEKLLMIQAAVTNPSHNRPGARCPVPDGMPLIKSGDQVSSYLMKFTSRVRTSPANASSDKVLFFSRSNSFMHRICKGQCP